MRLQETIKNLEIILAYFQDKLEKSEDTQEYTEYHIAITTLEEAKDQLEWAANLTYAMQVLMTKI